MPAVAPERPADEPDVPVRATLGELARYFTRLGLTAFGGPAAHIAIMQEDLVVRRRWVSRRHFLDMLAATQLVPGPNSTEMAIHIGYLHAGVAGLFVAGACFILPAFLIVLAISVAYVAFGALPQVAGLFYGIQPVIVAIVGLAAWRLAPGALRAVTPLALALAALLLTLLTPIDTVVVLLGGGLISLLLTLRPRAAPALALVRPDLRWLDALRLPELLPALQAAADTQLWQLGLFFLKVGATLMGSGYVLVSYLDNDLVRGYGWLSQQQLVDAIAVGQMTPGPVFTTAAFVGYVVRAAPGDPLRGLIGAAVCALAIFLPSFLIVWLLARWLPQLRRSRLAGAFLDGVNATVIGSIAATTWTLFRAAAIDLPRPVLALPLGGALLDVPATLLAMLAAGLLLALPRLNSTWLIGAGALIGLALTSLAW